MRVLEGLEPKKVFEYFEDLTQIPRGSGNEAGAAEYCMEFAKKRGLSASRDEFNNVVIVKEASASSRGIWIWYARKRRTVLLISRRIP